jgi:predicted  nucleic acid-binding Zn-ribbon protein
MEGVMKSHFEKTLADELHQWDEQIAQLETAEISATADEKVEYDQKILLLRAKHDEAVKKLEEIQAARDDAWEHHKEEAEKLWKELKMMLAW